MTNPCFPKATFCSHVIYVILYVCSIACSHSLYIFFVIFFSPYLLKLAAFLSPLFVATSLLYLVLLGGFTSSNDFQSRYDPILEKPHQENDVGRSEDDFDRGSEDLEVYEFTFGLFEEAGETYNHTHACESLGLPSMNEEKKLDNFLKILNQFESRTSNVEENQGVENRKSGSSVRHGSDVEVNEVNTPIPALSVKRTNSGKEAADSQRRFGNSPLMIRKEKKWNRTLSCMLFEERLNADGDEGMDLLWEIFENSETKKMKEADGDEGMDLLWENFENVETNKMKEDEVSEDGEEGADVQPCCFEALRFLSRKMNLGMGRPSLVRMSKVVKGMGWFHRAKRHNKKTGFEFMVSNSIP